MGRPVIDLTGRVFGRLTVLEQAPQPTWDKGYKVKWWSCRCECGTLRSYRGGHLKKGMKSCGCQGKEAVRAASWKHGLYKSREYGIWTQMMQRCHNPNSGLFARYGGKGLLVDEPWHAFPTFYAEMGICPPGYSLDRIDNTRGYSRANCQWANAFQQNRNRRQTHWIEWNGERLTVSEWARKLHATRTTIKHRWKTRHSLAPIKPRYWPRKLPADPAP